MNETMDECKLRTNSRRTLKLSVLRFRLMFDPMQVE
jgi:hypothetical protein